MALPKVTEYDEELGRGIREPKSAIEGIFDILSRPEYAVASAIRSAHNGEIGEIPLAMWEGLKGRRRISLIDIAADELGLSTEPALNIPDWKLVPDLFENIARGLSSPAGLTGMALGMVLDPLSWVSTFGLTKAGRLAQLARAAKYSKGKYLFPTVEAGKIVYPAATKVPILSNIPGSSTIIGYQEAKPLIEQGSKLARMLEHEFARTGKIPAPLANTWREQSLAGHRALMQAEVPWPLTNLVAKGSPFPAAQELIRGEPFFRAATKLNQLMLGVPFVNSARHFFSLADIPPEMLDDYARLNAQQRLTTHQTRSPLSITLHRIAGLINSTKKDYGEANIDMLRAVDGPKQWTKLQWEKAIRSVPIDQRWMGNPRYAIQAIDEAEPGTRIAMDQLSKLEIQQIKKGMGIPEDEELVYITRLGDKNLEGPAYPIEFIEPTILMAGGGRRSIQELATRGDFIGLDFKLKSQTAEFNQATWGLPGIRRIHVDYDWGKTTKDQLIGELDLLAKKKTHTPEDLERMQKLRSSIANQKSAENLNQWLVTAWTQLPNGRWELVDSDRFDNLQDIYDKVLHPAFAGKTGTEIDAKVAFKSDSVIKAAIDRKNLQSDLQNHLAEASRLAARVNESVNAKAKEITAYRLERLQEWSDLLEAINAEGGIKDLYLGEVTVETGEKVLRKYKQKIAEYSPTSKSRKRYETQDAERMVREKARRDIVAVMMEDVNRLRKKAKLPPIRSIINPNGISTEEMARRLGYEAEDFLKVEGAGRSPLASQLESTLASEIAVEARLWQTHTPWQEAKQQLYKDPDVARLERVRTILARFGLRTGPMGLAGEGAGTREKLDPEMVALAEGAKVRVPKQAKPVEIAYPAMGRAVTTVPAAEATLARKVPHVVSYKEPALLRWTDLVEGWGDLPRELRRAALLHRKLTRRWAEAELARGLITTIREGYHPHVQLSKLSVLKNLGLVNDRKAMQLPTLPFARRRKWQGSVLDLHDEMNEKVFVEDVISALAIRGVASARAVAQYDFITKAIRDFGRRVDLQRLDPATLDPRFALYLPKGSLGFRPYQTLSEKAARRNLKSLTGQTSGAKALRMAREEYNAPRLSMIEAMRRKFKDQGKALIEVYPDELRTVFGVTRDVPAYILPREIADFLNRANAFSSTPAGLQLAAGVIKRVRNVWVPWTLFLFPGYFTRNMVGAVMNNLYMGLTDWRNYARAKKVQDGRDFIIGAKAGGGELTANDVRKEVLELGVVDAGMATREAHFHGAGTFIDPEIALEKQILDEIRATNGNQSKIQTIAKKYGPHRVLQIGMRVNENIEANVRIALFIDRRLKGDTAELAARAVRKAQFDYDEITAADKWIRTYLLPFYVYTRKNIPFQIEHMAKHPEDFANINRVVRVLQASSQPQLEVLPQWMHESMPVRLGEDENGNGQFQYFTLRNWMPAAEVQGLFDPVRTMMGMMAPWFRLPLEDQINYSFYFRRPLEEYGGQRAKFMWWTLSRKEVEVLSTMRLLAEIDRIFPPSASSGTAGYRAEGMFDRIMASGFGFGKTFSIDMARQNRIARGQQQRIIREYTISMNRARKRKDWATVELLKKEIAQERKRTPDVVLPLSITGLPSAP